MLTPTDLCPPDVAKIPPERGVMICRYIKRPNPKPNDSPLLLFKIQWAYEAIYHQSSYYPIAPFLQIVSRRHRALFSTENKFRCSICDDLKKNPVTSSKESFFVQLVDRVAAVCIKHGLCQWSADERWMDLGASDKAPRDKETMNFYDSLDGWLDSMQAGNDTRIERLAGGARHEQRKSDFDGEDGEEVIILDDNQSNIPTPPVDNDLEILEILNNWQAGNDIMIERPAASARHKKRKIDFDGKNDKEGISYQQNRRKEMEATHGQRSTLHL